MTVRHQHEVDVATTYELDPVVDQPIDARRLAPLEIRDRRVVPRSKLPYIGLTVNPDGNRILFVEGASPADRAGLRAGDELVSLDGAAIRDEGALVERLRRLALGSNVRLVFRRDGAEQTIAVEVEGR